MDGNLPGTGEPCIGNYIPVRTLGEGTTGKVKLAFNKDTNENVAIKIIPKSSFEKKAGLETKVQREIALMGLVKHPNIMRLIDVFESPKHLYLVLEYAQQGELFDYLISRRVLPEDQALDFFRQIILALEYLHKHGICHRDLKPENILLDASTRIKIADFGFARWIKTNIAETSCGSPHYAAPEVISGKAYDGRKADIWSVGIILFALLAGYLPFDDASIRSLLHKVKRGTFQMPAFHPDIQDLIHRILTVDPDRRITIEEIKQHPCFRQGLNPEYILPKPLPFVNVGPINVEQINPDLLKNLLRIGFSEEDLQADLSSPENTMAKVFLTMLEQKTNIMSIPWDAADSNSVDILQQSEIMTPVHVVHFHPDSADPFQRHGVTPSESLSLSQMSYATQYTWGVEEQNNYLQEKTFETFGITIWQIMFNIQTQLKSMGMQWFHPNPQEIIARSEEVDLYVTIEGTFRTTEDVNVSLRLLHGDGSNFNELYESLQSALGVVA
ncbi:CAMK family protein kinase [Trichomonas vaginalis G3]|uniref:CAMK family protein kinase n=1 Tax=Trichomonas vaginalis (strain ATCC PRA-98 / G3) TaxID=412133 RepID=A2DI34_TRIV3|nr:STKc BRSK1 2 domain-containing protein [Trichomonas vaginalis G3]EAY20023.1 CAMK family protein kinase [Trichomonas vaginalis G3]KAI5525974.1 STKc BRSK1 2 domain-containing protein [Trichomonas vaginalis G3]|eukprot:XP_001581009.1 CAMK family protein kinase [Trichomonas vaginalis G3]